MAGIEKAGTDAREVIAVTLEVPQMQRDFESAVDLAVLHEITSGDALVRAVDMVGILNIFGQVELDVSQSNSLSFAGAGIFLQDF